MVPCWKGTSDPNVEELLDFPDYKLRELTLLSRSSSTAALRGLALTLTEGEFAALSIEYDRARAAGQRIRVTPLSVSTAAGGEDYELLFTAPPDVMARALDALAALRVPGTEIGTLESTTGVRLHDGSGQPVALRSHGWDHFGPSPTAHHIPPHLPTTQQANLPSPAGGGDGGGVRP